MTERTCQSAALLLLLLSPVHSSYSGINYMIVNTHSPIFKIPCSALKASKLRHLALSIANGIALYELSVHRLQERNLGLDGFLVHLSTSS